MRMASITSIIPPPIATKEYLQFLAKPLAMMLPTDVIKRYGWMRAALIEGITKLL